MTYFESDRWYIFDSMDKSGDYIIYKEHLNKSEECETGGSIIEIEIYARTSKKHVYKCINRTCKKNFIYLKDI